MIGRSRAGLRIAACGAAALASCTYPLVASVASVSARPRVVDSSRATTACRSSQLRIRFGLGQGAPYEDMVNIVIKNESARPCVLKGFPAITYVGPRGGSLGIRVVRARHGGRVRTVHLEPQGLASSLLVSPAPSDGKCRAVRATLRFRPPGQRRPLLLHTTQCRGHAKPQSIGPIMSGDGGIDPFLAAKRSS